MSEKTIITADDHPLLLKGLNDFLLEKNFNIIGSASNGNEAFNLIKKLFLIYKCHSSQDLKLLSFVKSTN